MPKSFNYQALEEEVPRTNYGANLENSQEIGENEKAKEAELNNGNGYIVTGVCQCGSKIQLSPPFPTPPQNGFQSITVTANSVDHCHDDEIRDQFDKVARRKLWIASGLCVVFMVGEAVGGVLAGSLAVATDAAHLLTDFAGFMISLFALYMSQRPATKRLSYGYHRAEVIGALTSVLLIWVVTGILVYMAVQRILYKEYDINAPIMLITSGIGVIINVIMGCTLHQHGHGHSHGSGGHGHSHGGHGHSHGNSHPNRSFENDVEASSSSSQPSTPDSEGESNRFEAPKVNINVRAAYIHVIGDFIQSIGVFAAALVIYFLPDWGIVDPICTFLFSILVLGTTYSIISDALVVLMEGIPKGIDFNEVRETLLSVKGVYRVHNLRIWSLSMDKIAMSTHLAVDSSDISSKSILRRASSLVRKRFGFSEVTIQIEDFHESMQDCVKCQELN